MRFITSDVKESPKFYKDFEIHGGIAEAKLSITGLGLYCAFINGVKAGDTYLAPGSNDYDGYLRYETIDVTELVKDRTNVIEVFLGNGWYKGRFGLMPRAGLEKLDYVLWASLKVILSDGTEVKVETDESWKAEESCIRSNSIYDGEVRDDTITAKETLSCRVIDKNFNLITDICPPIREKFCLKPELIVTPKGEKVLDFKQNMAGVIRFTNKLKKGQHIQFKFGEILIDGCFCNENYRSATGGFTYISDGTEKKVEAMFTYFGFRYVLVETDATINPEDFTAVVLYTDLMDTMKVSTSNPKLNRLLQNSVWGQRSNFLDVPTDCPQRDERLGWTGDAQVFANTACFHMNCEAFYRKYLMDLRYDQLHYTKGDIPMFSPCFGAGEGGGPAWADAATIIPWTMYEHYGNVENLRESYPMMTDYMQVLMNRDEESGGTHIISVGHAFGDWLALDGATENSFKGGTDDTYVRTVYYWYSATLTAKTAHVLGNAADASQFSDLASGIKAAILDEFFSPNGRLCIDTQTGYVLAIHFGLYPNKEKILEGFRNRLAQDRLRLKTGFVGTGFLLQTLFEAGMDDYAYRMLLTEAFPGWLYAVNLEATTIWERWNSVMPDGSLSPTGMNSLNHYSYGSVASAVYSYVAGLQLAAPGWKRAVIAPRPSYRLKSIDMAFDSPAGEWTVAWDIKKDGTLIIKATVPKGTSALIKLPLHPENAEYEVSAGTYEYSYKPTVDFTHPYSGDSFICDIVRNENVVKALTSGLPGVVEEPLATYDNNAASTLADAIFFSPVPDYPQKIDEILRGVEYEVK